jgi:hypothetical protein
LNDKQAAMPFLILFFVALAFWIHAERRLGAAARISGGIFSMALIGCAAYFVATIIPSYERTFHRSSMRLTGELISKGETQRVQQAIHVYNGIAATGTTYRAAMEMWDVLNHGTNK